MNYLFIGSFIALLKIVIEYPFYAKAKNERLFHGLGSLVIFTITVAVYIHSHDWRSVIQFFVAYYNVFEIGGNYIHGQNLLYVGENATLDKSIRAIYKDYRITKFIIYIIILSLLFL